jgi:hypothetical protein
MHLVASRAFLLLFCLAARFLGDSLSDMSYSNMLTKLYRVNMFHPVKLGLDNMNALNAMLKHPLKGIPVVHVAGTNGKGSVSLKIANSLMSSGITTGTCSSPADRPFASLTPCLPSTFHTPVLSTLHSTPRALRLPTHIFLPRARTGGQRASL